MIQDEGAGTTGPKGPPGQGRTAGRRRAIDAAARARIGRGLRLHYAEMLTQPIPERLRTLVDRLARSDTEDGR